jgi:DNA-binding beta-propeller fold protein YncE
VSENYFSFCLFTKDLTVFDGCRVVFEVEIGCGLGSHSTLVNHSEGLFYRVQMGNFTSEEFCCTSHGRTICEITIPSFRYEEISSMHLHLRFGPLVLQNSPLLISQPQIAQNLNELLGTKEICACDLPDRSEFTFGVSLDSSRLILVSTSDSGKMTLWIATLNLDEITTHIIDSDHSVNPSLKSPSFVVWSHKGVFILDDSCGVIKYLPCIYSSSTFRFFVCVSRDNRVVTAQGRFVVSMDLLTGEFYARAETRGDCEAIFSMDSRVVVVEKVSNGMFISVFDTFSLHELSRSPLQSSEDFSLFSFCKLSGLLYAFSKNMHVGCFNMDGKKVTSSVGWRTDMKMGEKVLSVIFVDKRILTIVSTGSNTCRVSALDASKPPQRSELRFALKWELIGKQPGQFRKGGPNGIAILGSEVFVANFQSASLSVFDKNGSFLRLFERNSLSNHDYLTGPNFLLAFENMIFVSEDFNQFHRILVFDVEGNKIETISSKGRAPGSLEGPQGMVFVNDELFVAEELNDRISVFSFNKKSKTKFQFRRTLGRRGSGEVEFNNPKGMALSLENLIYIVDSENHRIQVIDTDGKFIRQFGSKGSEAGCEDGRFRQPHGIEIAEGRVMVSDKFRNDIQVFNLSGTYLYKFGSQGSEDGFLNKPRQIASSNGTVYVCDERNGRIQGFE